MVAAYPQTVPQSGLTRRSMSGSPLIGDTRVIDADLGQSMGRSPFVTDPMVLAGEVVLDTMCRGL